MDKKPREQVVEHLQTANNVLVTLSRNPSVDQLAACIGLTLLLNKLGKHATAVFSGQIPSTLEFLQPEKTLQKTTDSLRDFIIALDKSKADKLRYKVEDEMVKIFITPYRTSLTQKDLQFGQGDFNVDVVMALGVHQKEDLDQSIITHGRILHDATVISVNNVENGSLGTLNWVDTAASSLCEMLASIAQDLNKNILDTQIATALLTGIVAETERFSNQKVNPNTMSLAGVLMAAGANSQLVASKLEQPMLQPAPARQQQPRTAPAKPNGELTIVHEEREEPVVPAPGTAAPQASALDYGLHDEKTVPDQIHIDEQGQLSDAGQAARRLMSEPPTPVPAAPIPTPIVEPATPAEPNAVTPSVGKASTLSAESGVPDENQSMDSLTLPAPIPPGAHILKHSSRPASSSEPEPPKPVTPVVPMPPQPAPTPLPEEPTIRDEQTLTDIEETVHSPHLMTPAAPAEPAPAPQASPAPPPTPISEPAAPPTPLAEEAPQPSRADQAAEATSRAEEARAKIQEAFNGNSLNAAPTPAEPVNNQSDTTAPPQGPPPMYPV